MNVVERFILKFKKKKWKLNRDGEIKWMENVQKESLLKLIMLVQNNYKD